MSSGQVSAGYAIGSKSSVTHRYPVNMKSKKIKLSIKQRIRNWLHTEDVADIGSIPIATIEPANRIDSEGMRFQLWKASGGYVIETRSYDRRTDRSDNKMYVITEDKDLGAEIGKIITMETLRG